jgi:hypothetical protein
MSDRLRGRTCKPTPFREESGSSDKELERIVEKATERAKKKPE